MLLSKLCLTLWDPMDCSWPGSSVDEILQARILEWVAIRFSRGIFLTEGLNLGLLHCKYILYHLSHSGKPITLCTCSHVPTSACVCVCSVLSDFCDPMDCCLPRSSVYGIFQAWILEWITISYSTGSSKPSNWNCVSGISCIGRQIIYYSPTWEVGSDDLSCCRLQSLVVGQLLSRVQLFVTRWTAAHWASLSFTISQSLLRLVSIESWCHPIISSSVAPFSSCLQSFLTSGSFPMSRLFPSVLEFQLQHQSFQWTFNIDFL